MPSVETYFITWKGKRDGPFTLEQLEEMLRNGDVGLLHSVETSSGTMPLRQLLELAHPSLQASTVTSERATETPTNYPSSTQAPGAVSEAQVVRLYTLCGWCFALPPLAWWTWGQARILAAQGQTSLANRIKGLSTGLAIAGVALWILLWRIW